MNETSSQKTPLFGYFFRSQLAHAEVIALNLVNARESQGVHLVLDAAGLNKLGLCTQLPAAPILAADMVRFLGEAVVLIVAETEAQAKAAADLVELDLLELPEIRQLVPGGTAIHPQAPGNLAFDDTFGPLSQVAAALAAAPHRAEIELGFDRVPVTAPAVNSVRVEWSEGHLTMHLQGGGVWADAKELAVALGADKVTVLNPDLGQFSRSQSILPEYLCLAAAARALQQPIFWRATAMQGARTDRGMLVRAEIGFDADFCITALRVNLVSNLGAYAFANSHRIQTEAFAAMMTRDYDIGLTSLGVLGVYSNAAPQMAHSGSGLAEARLTIEQLLDAAARKFQIDPVDLRRRNLRGALQAPDTAVAAVGYALASPPLELARVLLTEDGGAQLALAGGDPDGAMAAAFAAATGLAADQIDLLPGKGFAPAQQISAALSTATEHLIGGLTLFLQQDVGAKEVRFAAGDFTAQGSNMRLSLSEAAEWAREKGREDLLDIVDPTAKATATLHRAEVEGDATTGALRLIAYWPESRFPFAKAVLHHLVTECRDDNASESAILLPDLHAMQGVSEADSHTAAAAIVNAVQDLVARRGGGQVSLPLSPSRLRGWLKEADAVNH